MTDDLKLFRADEPLKRLAGVLAVVAVVMLTITAHTMAYQDEIIMEQMRAEAAEKRAGQFEQDAQKADHYRDLYAQIKTACMNERLRITWIDPHTKDDMAAICDVVKWGRLVR